MLLFFLVKAYRTGKIDDDKFHQRFGVFLDMFVFAAFFLRFDPHRCSHTGTRTVGSRGTSWCCCVAR